METVARWILLAGLLCCAACPRVYPQGVEPPTYGSATHPWELPGWPGPAKEGAGTPPQDSGGAVELPAGPGPAIPAIDSFDPQYVPGQWLQVCEVSGQEMQLGEAGAVRMLELHPGGALVYQSTNEGETQTTEGTWRKVAPGVLALAFGQSSEAACYGQLFEQDFLFLYSYDSARGYWLARAPAEGSQVLNYSHYSTSRGKLHIASQVSGHLSGSATADTGQLSLDGFYQRGVMALRWVDKKHNASGFCAFVVDANSGALHGAWWLEDSEAPPFSGSWDGQAEQ